MSPIADNRMQRKWRRRVELPTLQLGESIEEKMPKFSARAPNLQLARMSSESSRRKEARPVEVGRLPAPKLRRNFRVIGQLDSGLVDAFGHEMPDAPSRPFRESLKRIFDIVGACLLGIIFTPFILVIAVLLKREGGGVIFRHRRIGRNGQVFDCLKFRSMVPNADRVLRELLEQRPELKAEWLRDHKLRDDPRITSVGRFLRRTSLDELPQLWNVIRGEMSLVGPRPVVREELLRYGRHIHRYLSARPGVTGLWQVTGRTNTDYRRRVVLDVFYVRRQSLLLDFYILLKTTHVVVGGTGAY
jgi:exopolysaccharide production protein ExoY